MAKPLNKVDALGRAELFEGVETETLREIAQITEIQEFEEGDVLYRLGDDAENVYVLVSGRVRFTLGVGNRGQGSGSIMSGHMILGWAALVDDQPRRVATAECLEDSVVLAIKGNGLKAVLERRTHCGFLVMRRLATMIAHNFMDLGSN